MTGGVTHDLASSTVRIHPRQPEVSSPGVCPVNFVLVRIVRDRLGPRDVGVHEDRLEARLQVLGHDAWIFSVGVGPEDCPESGIFCKILHTQNFMTQDSNNLKKKISQYFSSINQIKPGACVQSYSSWRFGRRIEFFQLWF